MSQQTVPVLHVQLPAEPGASRSARKAVAGSVSDLRGLKRADLNVLVSDLVGAMAGEAHESVTLDLRRTEQGLRVEVRSSGDVPSLDPLTITLLDQLASQWSVDGGLAWFELTTSSPFNNSASNEDLFTRSAAGDLHARDELAERYLYLARSISRRFISPGIRREDVEQVASAGLIKALERFDPGRGVRFTTFAARTIEGELKRHLRDSGWSVRVPRELQEIGLEATKAADDMTKQEGRSPTLEELSEAIDADLIDLGQALLARRSFNSASLDRPTTNGASSPLVDAIPAHDERLRMAPEWTDVSEVMGALPHRQQRILYLRFFEDLTQSEIAHRIGISQMHVSRLLARSIAQMRER